MVASDKRIPDFRAPEAGFLTVDNGYFRFRQSGRNWLKTGTNSPENLLAFADFDATYRLDNSARSGEAAPEKTIHHYAPHVPGLASGRSDLGGR